MQTLDRPILHVPDRSTPACEQAIPGNATEDESEGRIGSGTGPAPQPLQGDADPNNQKEVGNEGDGT